MTLLVFTANAAHHQPFAKHSSNNQRRPRGKRCLAARPPGLRELTWVLTVLSFGIQRCESNPAACFTPTRPDCFNNHKEETKLVSKATVFLCRHGGQEPRKPQSASDLCHNKADIRSAEVIKLFIHVINTGAVGC